MSNLFTSTAQKIGNTISRFFKRQSQQVQEKATVTASRFNPKLSKSDATDFEKKLTRRQKLRLAKNRHYRSYNFRGAKMQKHWFGTFSKLFYPKYRMWITESGKTHIKKCHEIIYACKAEKKAIKRMFRNQLNRKAA